MYMYNRDLNEKFNYKRMAIHVNFFIYLYLYLIVCLCYYTIIFIRYLILKNLTYYLFN